MILRASDDGRVIAARVSVAQSFAGRLRGLMGRRQIAEDEGLYLPGTNGVHMLFMRFPIDCVFVGQPAADGWQRAVDIRSSLQPWRGIVWYVSGAKGVVELPEGTVARTGLRVGDLVQLVPAAD